MKVWIVSSVTALLLGYALLVGPSLLKTVKSGQLQGLPVRLTSRGTSDKDVSSGLGLEMQQWLQGTRSLGRRVVLRYSVCGGLINQQYSHISAFLLAMALKAEVVLPPACYRNSFGLHYDMNVKRNKMAWYAVPSETLLDVESVISVWGTRGILVHKAGFVNPDLDPSPNFTQPATAFPAYIQSGIDPRLIVRLQNVYLGITPLSVLVARVQEALTDHLQVMAPALAASTDYVVLDLPCTFFAIRTVRALPLATQVAQALPFNSALEALALRTVTAMRAAGVETFNGVHLRVEKDAGDWTIIMGGQGVIWHLYLGAMRAVGFNSNSSLYVATGLLTYGASREWEDAKTLLLSHKMASRVVIKDEFVPDFELKGEAKGGGAQRGLCLNTEQLALLDFLILAHSSRFVGFGSSTFSFYLTQHRAIHGFPASSSVLVNAKRIGTDDMFAAAAVITHAPLMHVVRDRE